MELNQAIDLLTDAQKAAADGIQAVIDRAASISDVSPSTDLQSGLGGIQEKMDKMFIKLEETIRSLPANNNEH